MSSQNYEGSFLARLGLVDGTQLGFFKIVQEGENRRLESHDYLCANSMLDNSLEVHFQPNSEGAYILSCRLAVPEHDESDRDYYEFRKNEESSGSSASAGGGVQVPTVSEESAYEKALWEDRDPELLNYNETDASPLADLKAGPVYLAVNEGGWVHRTRNGGLAYLATIVMADKSDFSIERKEIQRVYLKSWRSNKNIQTYKREEFPSKGSLPDERFAWMTDCDGKDAVLKLKILERYKADGSVY
ncbi:hypothetical protein [Pseudomonas viridiflava]|uniref:hypothetical protein n=1 Tax=Pseudomonas viridiflava TaxID=33069 RepID=UPI0013CF392E|nr:hypothetical protein [Pseudomonas viridiflava]